MLAVLAGRPQGCTQRYYGVGEYVFSRSCTLRIGYREEDLIHWLDPRRQVAHAAIYLHFEEAQP